LQGGRSIHASDGSVGPYILSDINLWHLHRWGSCVMYLYRISSSSV